MILDNTRERLYDGKKFIFHLEIDLSFVRNELQKHMSRSLSIIIINNDLYPRSRSLSIIIIYDDLYPRSRSLSISTYMPCQSNYNYLYVILTYSLATASM